MRVLCVSFVESIDLQKIGKKERKKSLVLPQSEKHYPREHSSFAVSFSLRASHSAIACTGRALNQGTSPTLGRGPRTPVKPHTVPLPAAPAEEGILGKEQLKLIISREHGETEAVAVSEQRSLESRLSGLFHLWPCFW